MKLMGRGSEKANLEWYPDHGLGKATEELLTAACLDKLRLPPVQASHLKGEVGVFE